MLIRAQREMAGRHADSPAAGRCKGAGRIGTGRGAAATIPTRQFALLALHEAERAGVSASDQTWRLACRLLGTVPEPATARGAILGGSDARHRQHDLRRHHLAVDCRRPDAPATPGSSATASSAAFLATTRITIASSAACVGSGSIIRSRQSGQQRRPLAALLSLWTGARRPVHRAAVPFVAVAAGQPDRADWYREGADCWSATRTPLSGFWSGTGRGENEPLIGTSFALLFLSKGRWPVLLAQTQARRRPTIGTAIAATWPT